MTDFLIDVFIGGTDEEHVEIQKNRYGFNDQDAKQTEKNECCSLVAGDNGFLLPQKMFYLKLEQEPTKNIPVFVHELWHIMWHISQTVSDFNFSKEGNAYGAYMIEQITKQIIESKYEQI